MGYELALSFSDFSEILRNLSLTASAPIAAWIAWRGLTTWKEEKRWERDHDLAKNLMVQLQIRKDAFRRIRNGFMSAAEMDEAVKEADLNVEEIGLSNDGAWIIAMNARLKRLAAIRQKFYSYQIEAEALWGDETLPTVAHEMLLIEADVIAAVHQIASFKSHSYVPERSQEARDAEIEARKAAFGGDGDELDRRFDEKVTLLKSHLKKRLRS